MNRKSEICNYIAKQFGPPASIKCFYHYTTMEALINGIIKKNPIKDKEICLRLTHCGYLNDSKEIQTGIDFLINYYYEQEKELYPNLSRKEYICHFNKEIANQWKYRFVFSMSSISDSLPMWNAYANNGKGIAIGIRRFDSLSDKDLVLNCLYSKKSCSKKLSVDTHDKRLTLAYTPLLMKNKAYQYEKEIRLIGIFEDTNVQYKEKNGALIPYKEIFLPKELITSITIGPAANQLLVNESLRRFLNDNGLSDVRLKLSKIPYRNL